MLATGFDPRRHVMSVSSTSTAMGTLPVYGPPPVVPSSSTADLSTGLAWLGRAQGTAWALLGIVVGVVLFFIGRFLQGKSIQSLSARVSTTRAPGDSVEPVECRSSTRVGSNGRPITTLECTALIQYTVGNVEYQQRVDTEFERKTPGSSINIYIETGRPEKVYLSNPNTWGLILVIIGISVVVGAAFSMFLTWNSDVYATVQGAATAVSVARNAFT